MSRHEPPVGVVEHGDDERRLRAAVHDLPDHVRRLVAVEGGAEHLQLEVRARAPATPRRGASSSACRTKSTSRSRSANGGLQPKSRKISTNVARRLVRGGVVAPVVRRVRLDVLGRDRGAHEHEAVVDVGAPQHPGHDRVEERLRQLRPLVVDEQPDVEQLRLPPGVVVERACVELRREPLDALPHALVVEADPLLAPPAAAPSTRRASNSCFADALVARKTR